MILLVLSDIHGNQEALDTVLSDFIKRYRDRIPYEEVYTLVLGDTIDYGADSLYCVQRILSFCSDHDFPLFTVRGNHENAVLYESIEGINTPHGKESVRITRDELKSYCTEIRLNLCSNLIEEFLLPSNSRGLTLKVRMTHSGNSHNPLTGSPEFLEKFKWEPNSVVPKVEETCDDIALQKQFNVIPVSHDWIINLFGHSHIPYFRRSNCQVYFNPGSVGQPRDGDCRASYGVIEEDDGELSFFINRVNYDIIGASHKIKESGRAYKLYHRLFEGK